MKKSQFALLIVTCVFLCVLLGIFIGRNVTEKLTLSASPSASGTPAAYNAGKIDINTATASQLTMLPGIGETLAQRIVEYREENGAYTSTADLIFVEGIGSQKLEAILDYITVGG